MSAALRIDLGQPLPFRRTPEFLFGETRRRTRRLGGAAGGLLAVAVVAAWWVTGTHTFRNVPGESARPSIGTAPAASTAIARQEAFPLIAEPQASATAREREDPPFRVEAPSFEEIAPPAPAPVTATAAMAPPRPAQPLRSRPLVEEEPSPGVSPVAPAPSAGSAAAAVGDAGPAEQPLPAGKDGRLAAPEHHYLQFGTYRLEESVTTVQRQYQKLGLSTIIQREGDYYVLRLLPFATREAAEQEQARLQEMGIQTLYIPPPAPQP